MQLADLISQHDHTAVTDGVVAEQHMLAVPDSAATVAINLSHSSAV
jgi:hypothetical protein